MGTRRARPKSTPEEHARRAPPKSTPEEHARRSPREPKKKSPRASKNPTLSHHSTSTSTRGIAHGHPF
ncbi:hypothetical protein K457DRAFT_25184 [Linnemannia elongata AG-77]|uniref:Uncharacterized protein n=1 Tax=Linnemannia elongata AG-77 TaxID=1314771 RepID=A0A197JE51_9FUNG|nr:hypothetical protein K457DRAFT_25184 [Linnemannia elongata AG-77]